MRIDSLLDELARAWHEWLAVLTRKLYADAPAEAVRFLEAMLPNIIPLIERLPIRVQLHLAVGMFPFFYSHVVPRSVLDWVESMGAELDGCGGEDEPRWLALRSFVHRIAQGSVDQAREQKIISSLNAAPQNGDLRNQCRAMSQAQIPAVSGPSSYWKIIGDHVQTSLVHNANARRLHDSRRIERAARRSGSRLAELATLHELGYLMVVAGELTQAKGHYERTARLSQECGLSPAASMAWLAHIACLGGDHDMGLAEFGRLHRSESVAQRRLLHGHMATWWLSCALDCHDWVQVDRAERAVDEVWSAMDPEMELGHLARYESRVLAEQGRIGDAWSRLAKDTSRENTLSRGYAEFEAGFLKLLEDDKQAAAQRLSVALQRASYYGSRLLAIQGLEVMSAAQIPVLGEGHCAKLVAAAAKLRAKLGLFRPKRISLLLDRLELDDSNECAGSEEVLDFFARFGVVTPDSEFLISVNGVDILR